MKFLKNLVLSLLSFLLFLSLSIFGLAFMLNRTVLNPTFVTAELDRLDISTLVDEILTEQTPGEFKAALVSSIDELEPRLKEELDTAIYSIYDYLLGKNQSLDLALTLKNTFLNRDFIVSVVDRLDMSVLIQDLLSNQITGQVPAELGPYVQDALDKVIPELKPWIEEQVSAAADPIAGYLLGESQDLNVVIFLGPLKESLRTNIREAFLESPPSELAGISQAELEQYFDQFYEEFSAQLPPALEINESWFGTQLPSDIAQALTKAENILEQVKQYVSYYQLGYKVLIGFMVLLILGIIFIIGQVRGATRSLGTTFLTYGALEYAGIFATKYFIGTQLPLPDIPLSLQTWFSQFLDNIMAPLQTLSLGFIIGGIVLILVSFIYKPHQSSTLSTPNNNLEAGNEVKS
ncbi:MAG: hypothetical protein PHN78_05595 [Dehalococcoidales bacterium]|nr:hypothetical protein [Dehalococcoidales bacterium]